MYHVINCSINIWIAENIYHEFFELTFRTSFWQLHAMKMNCRLHKENKNMVYIKVSRLLRIIVVYNTIY